MSLADLNRKRNTKIVVSHYKHKSSSAFVANHTFNNNNENIDGFEEHTVSVKQTFLLA